jgi:hypothetical protein
MGDLLNTVALRGGTMSRGWTFCLPKCMALRPPKQYLIHYQINDTLHTEHNARTPTRVTFFL